MHSKRSLYTQQKRPAYTAKEACIHNKRDLEEGAQTMVEADTHCVASADVYPGL